MNSIAVHTPIGWFKVSEDSGYITEVKYIDGVVDLNSALRNCFVKQSSSLMSILKVHEKHLSFP